VRSMSSKQAQQSKPCDCIFHGRHLGVAFFAVTSGYNRALEISRIARAITLQIITNRRGGAA